MKRPFRLLFYALAALVLGMGLGVLVVAWRWSRDLPSMAAFESLQLTSTTTLLARDGTPIATLASVEEGRALRRRLVRLDEVSPAAVAAVVASEDRRFFRHHGIDWVRFFGALWRTLRGDLQGGSTITTQVIKNTLLKELASQRSLERKFKEFLLALELERRYTKEEILGMYLNVAFWGGNLAGIAAASEAYFGKDPSTLTLAEGAYLAVLIPAPNARYRDLKGTLARARHLIRQMQREGWVSPEEATRAFKAPLVPRGWQARYDEEGRLVSATLKDPEAQVLPDLAAEVAPHFVLEVRKALLRRFGPERVFGQGGLKVTTTLDLGMQNAAEAAARYGMKAGLIADKAQLALVGLDPKTGEVLALLGALPGTQGEYNRATQIQRSPGSAVKPFVYATALESGWSEASPVWDKPVEFKDPSQPSGIWKPKNFSGTFLNRPITVRYALDRSLNIPAVLTAEAIGVKRLAAKLTSLGFTLPRHPSLAIAIGAVGASPLQMASAYAAFLEGGLMPTPHLIRRVEDASGEVLYHARPLKKRVFDEKTAYLGWDLLKGYVYDPDPFGKKSLAWRARIPGRVVGGKTGTSNEARDLWFAGGTPGLVAAVWMGRDDNKPLRWRGKEPSSSVLVPPIWRRFVEEALRGRPAREPEPPEGLHPLAIDLLDGVPRPDGVKAYFRSGREPVATLPTGGFSWVPLDPARGCQLKATGPLIGARWVPLDPKAPRPRPCSAGTAPSR